MSDESGGRRVHTDGYSVGSPLWLGPIGRTIAAVVLAAAGWLSLSTLAPPAGVSDADGFSLGRAIADVERIAGEPRPTGSAAHDRVRRYLLDEIGRAGLAAEVQEAVVPTGDPAGVHRLTRVRNVIARLPGRGEGDAILLASHYDSVPASPGAGDDAAGVAALLETMRVLAEGEPLSRDIIFLFTDAEELGLLGARAFVDAGLADGVGWVLNFEARGAGGASIMFETLPGDVETMGFFANASPRPVASSYSYDVYRLMSNDTDFSVFREGIPAGFNFAFIEDPAAYHSSVDTPGRLDQGSLLHHGVQALSLARGLSDSPPEARGQRAVYFSLPGYGLAVYTASWDGYVATGVSVLAVVAVGIGFSRRRLRPLRGLVALGAVLAGIGVSVAMLMALDRVWTEGLGLARDTKGVLTLFGYAWLLVAAGVTWLFATWFARRAGAVHLSVAAACWWTLLAGLASWLLASSAFLFTWPVLFIWLALLLTVVRGERPSRWLAPAALACALPAVLIWLPSLKGLAVALGPSPVILGLAASLPVLLLSLQAAQLTGAGRHRWWLPTIVLAVGLGLFGWAAMQAGPSPAHPRANSLVYALDAGTGEALWASYDDAPDDWTRQALGDDPRRRTLPGFFNDELELMTAPAETAALPGPGITRISSGRLDDDGVRMTLAVRSARAAPVIEVVVDAGNGRLRRARVDGRTLATSGKFRFTYHAVPPEGIELELELDGEGSVEVTAVDGSFGLPRFAGRPPGLEPRREPRAVNERRFPVSDMTLVRTRRTIGVAAPDKRPPGEAGSAAPRGLDAPAASR